jgi:hypothetical protein
MAVLTILGLTIPSFSAKCLAVKGKCFGAKILYTETRLEIFVKKE